MTLPPEEKDLWSKITAAVASSRELHFVKDTLKRVFIFVVIALSAVGLHACVEVLKEHEVSVAITAALTAVEYLILVADVVWLAKPLVIETVASLKEMFGGQPLLIIIIGLVIFIAGVVSSPYLIASIQSLGKKLLV
jgi:hypothetical protein